jgi:flagellar transcriptional activator FlhD
MQEAEVTNEITDLNITYVLLAQKLLRTDRAAAMLRLGLSAETADFLESLSVRQALKLATTSFMLCSLRMGDLMENVVRAGRDVPVQQAHLAIVLAGRVHQREGLAV